MKNILLLTSTIKPKSDQPQLKLTNPEERLEDYRKALVFYNTALGNGVIDGIVFVDNSGFDLKCLSDAFPSDKIEWLSFYGLDYPSSYHRGYGEFKLIDYAFLNSSTLSRLAPDDAVWKITGRYVLNNIRSVIRYAPQKFSLYCDITKNWVDMGVMAWGLAGYTKYISGVCEKFKTSMAPELILAQLINDQPISNSGIFKKFWWKPLLIGKRGTDGANFQGKLTYVKFVFSTLVNWLKFNFRNFFSVNSGK